MQQVQGTSRPAVYPNSFFKASKFPLQSAELELTGVEARRPLASKQEGQPPRCSLPPVALLWRCCLISDIQKVKTFVESIFGQKNMHRYWLQILHWKCKYLLEENWKWFTEMDINPEYNIHISSKHANNTTHQSHRTDPIWISNKHSIFLIGWYSGGCWHRIARKRRGSKVEEGFGCQHRHWKVKYFKFWISWIS